MTGPRVVRVGDLKPPLVAALAERWPSPSLDDVAPEDLAGVEVVVTSAATGARREHLDRLPGLGAIVSFGVGTDATDLAAARERGVPVATTPDVLTDCVADTAVGLVIDVMRGLSAADRFVRRGDWERGGHPLGRRVSGARVGIVGLGRIGAAVAGRLTAFDCDLAYTARTPKEVDLPYVASTLELARRSEVLVLTVPGGSGTDGLVGAEVLDALGPDGFLVNVARGSVVDEVALVSALQEGRIAGAGLDVFADEPQVPRALLDRDDVVLLPHLASGTVETRAAMTDLVMANVAAYLERGELLTPIA